MTVRAKHIFFVAFGLMTLFVFYLYEAPFLDSHSPAWQHIEPVKWLMLLHGPAGALALLLAPFQFSTRLRKRSLRLHRIDSGRSDDGIRGHRRCGLAAWRTRRARLAIGAH